MVPALVWLAVLVGPAAARADAGATLYVDQHDQACSSAGAGTAAQPFCTITAAAARTAPGTTVLISSGAYAETVKPPVSGTPGNRITYMAAPGASVTVTGSSSSSYAFEVAGKSWIALRGLSISRPSGGLAAVEVTNSVTTSSGTTAPSNVDIVDNDVMGGVSIDSGSQVSVVGNRSDMVHLRATASDVEDNTVDGIALNGASHSRVAGNSIGAGGLYVYASSDDTLAANVIHTTGKGIDSEFSNDIAMVDNTIVVYPSPTTVNAYGINVLGGAGAQILSNSVAQFAPSDAVAVQGSATLANNVIDVFHSLGGAAIRVCKGCQAGTSMDYDVVSAARGAAISWNGSTYGSLASFTAATGQEAHGIQAPPGFADPADGNLSLTPGAAAVDSAFSGTLTTPSGSLALPATDAWGGARVDDAATANAGAGTIGYADRGAYELRNPGFEAGTAGWNTSVSGPGVTLTRVAGGHAGGGAALMTNTGTTDATCALNDSPNLVHTTTAGTYTATLWVRSDHPGATLTLRLREWVGGTAVGQAKARVTLTGQWQAATVRYTVVDPGASTLDFSAYVLQAPPGTCFSADDASIAADLIVPAAAAANRLTVPDGAADDGLGGSVAVSGDTMVVGAPYAAVDGHAGQGAVYVFTRSGGAWTQQARLTASDGAAGNDFGYSVAITGETVVVGAPAASVGGSVKQGAAYVFTGSGGAWTQQAKLTASGGAADYQIGYSVAISGDTVVAGAPGCPTDLTPEWTTVSSLPGGRAYVFASSGGVWSRQAELMVASGCVRSVAASGTTAVLGVLGWGAYVFSESSGVWTLQTTLIPAGLTGYYPIAQSVAISGNTAVVGVPRGSSGAAYVFTDDGGTWTQQGRLTASDGNGWDLFGTALAISDGTILAGAPGATVDGHPDQGAAYVFAGSGGTWTQQTKLTASDGAAGDELGASAALSGNTIAAGALYGHSLQGAAYTFDGW